MMWEEKGYPHLPWGQGQDRSPTGPAKSYLYILGHPWDFGLPVIVRGLTLGSRQSSQFPLGFHSAWG